MIVDRVRGVVEPLLADSSVELVDLEHTGGILRVTVDRPGGVDLELIARLTRLVSRALDDEDPLPGRYTLEVSSPGLERQLKTPAHYRRFVGTQLNVKLTAAAAADADRRFRATLDDADDEGFSAGGRRCSYGDVELTMTVFEWGPQPKPGGKPPKTQKKAKVQP